MWPQCKFYSELLTNNSRYCSVFFRKIVKPHPSLILNTYRDIEKMIKNFRHYLNHTRLFLPDFPRQGNLRFYARGSRFLDYHNNPRGNDSDIIDTSKTKDVSVTLEPPKQLLENAKISEKFDIANTFSLNSKSSLNRRDQTNYAYRPNTDPSNTSILLFPGQGTQFAGMGKDLLKYPMVKEMYELASSILGYNLLSLCLDGPKQTLDQTLFSQPAILVTSLACVQKLKAINPEAVDSCIATAGFSVGELAALVFAKAITFENAVKLVKIRAEAMQLASEAIPSGMMTVFYGPDSSLNRACHEAREHCKTLGLDNIECSIANYLYPECKVIAGNLEALDFISKNAGHFKLRKIKRIPVSGAFHTKLMESASAVLVKALKTFPISEPTLAVHSNIDGKRYRSSEHIKKFLPRQITNPVRWEQTMHILYERNKTQKFPKTYECGPGRSLKAILAKVNSKASQFCINIDV